MVQHPQLREPPAANPQSMIRCFGDDAAQPIRFYVYQDVLEELTFAARYEARPYAAVLVGGFGIEENMGFIEVVGFTGAASLDDLDGLYDTLRPATDHWIQSAPDDPIVGLFVSSPGCGGKVDDEMARVHFSLFNIPFEPLVVLDPTSGDLTVNARAPGTRLFNAAFRVVAIRPTASLNGAVSSGKRSGSSEEE